MPSTMASTFDQMRRSDASRMAPFLADRDEGNSDQDKRARDVGESDEGEFLPVQTLRQQFLDYLDAKVEEIEEQKDARRYFHGAQLTGDQLRILKDRHQPVQIWNQIGRKISGIVGMVERMRCDPKAEGTDPKSEQGAEVAGHAIRYVLDASEFKNSIDPWTLLQAGIDGVGGVQLVLQQGDKGDPDIGLHWVIGDEYFYDPRSYHFRFKDVRYEGIGKWMDLEDGIQMFPGKEEQLKGLFQGDSDLSSYPDREMKFLILSAKRLRIIEHWYKHKGKWCWAFYASNVLLDQGVSPFFDERGISVSPFEMFAAMRDHDGDCYGFVRNLKGPQDALNQGKSKALALANSRRIIAEQGAVADVETARREAARHDGYIEVARKDALFQVQDTHPDIATFMSFTENAKAEIDGFANSNVAAMTGQGLTNLSGRALELLRQPGMAELGPFVMAHRGFKLGLYRKIWTTVQRHWTAERWIRVAGNEKLAQFIQLNGVDLDQWGRPVMVNAVGALDVNIVLDEGPDIVSMMQETYDTLKGYPPGTFPPQVLIEMNPNLPRSEKDRLLQMMAPKPPPQDPMAEMVKKLQLEGLAGRNAKTAADVRKTHASAEQALATAHEKRANVGDLAHDQHLDAAEFSRDTLFEAHRIAQAMQPQQQGQGQGGGGQQQPPFPGAKKGRDGRLYVDDPHRPGKYLMVA